MPTEVQYLSSTAWLGYNVTGGNSIGTMCGWNRQPGNAWGDYYTSTSQDFINAQGNGYTGTMPTQVLDDLMY